MVLLARAQTGKRSAQQRRGCSGPPAAVSPAAPLLGFDALTMRLLGAAWLRRASRVQRQLVGQQTATAAAVAFANNGHLPCPHPSSPAGYMSLGKFSYISYLFVQVGRATRLGSLLEGVQGAGAWRLRCGRGGTKCRHANLAAPAFPRPHLLQAATPMTLYLATSAFKHSK